MAKRKKMIENAAGNDLSEKEFIEKIKEITEGLYYMSESDAEIHPFMGNKVEMITDEELLKENKSPDETPIEKKEFNDFFTYLTEFQDWFGDEERNTARKFGELKELLENNLKRLQVYKIGRIELDVYVVGLNCESKIAGVKTKAIET